MRGSLEFWQAERPLDAYLPDDPETRFELHPSFVGGTKAILWGRLDFMRAWLVLISQPREAFTIAKH